MFQCIEAVERPLHRRFGGRVSLMCTALLVALSPSLPPPLAKAEAAVVGGLALFSVFHGGIAVVQHTDRARASRARRPRGDGARVASSEGQALA